MNIDDLLQAEKTRKGFTTEQRAAMWRGIQTSVGTAATGAVAASAASKIAPKAAAKAASKLAKWKLGMLLTMAAIAGGGVGAAMHAKWGAPKIVTVEHVVPAETVTVTVTAPPPAALPEPTASASPLRAAAAAKASASPANAREKDASLARERTLLDMARTALSRGDANAALASLETHAREFPQSQLSEEREVLAIQALASAGRMPEARQRAAAFRKRFVNSSLTPIVDEATQ